MTMQQLYLLVPLAPLAAAVVVGLFGTKMPRSMSHWLTIAGVAVAFAASFAIWRDVAAGHTFNGDLYTWLAVGSLKMSIGFLIDPLTTMMMLVVTFVSLMVHVYTIGYMADDSGYSRFFSYISLFTFAMLMLVMSNNFLQLFFGWEAVGLVSYLLIGFWFARPTAIYANLKAFLANRVGDFGFILGIGLVLAHFGSMDYAAVFAKAPSLASATISIWGTAEWSLLSVTCICLFIGAMGKSAQVPLHVWLPDSMEGPTPISALIHAATMVTAGIFMVARMSPLFELSDTALSFVTVIGATTALFMGILGVVQNDIKRVVAYSTLSQLGYMTVALGVSAYSAAIFHLMTHAFFKALLFLGAGSVIIALHHVQDLRQMGGLRKYMPVTYVTMLIGSLALCGIPPFAGFFSKDAIIEAAYAAGQHRGSAMLGFVATVIAAGLTSFYSWRLVFMTFFGKRAEHEVARDHSHDEPDAAHAHDDHAQDDHAHDEHGHGHAPHESPIVMLIPLFVLALGAVAAGYVFSPFFTGHAYEEFWKGAIFTGEHNHLLHEMHDIPAWVGFAPSIMMALGFLMSLYVYVLKPGTAQQIAHAFPGLYQFLLNKWYFDELYDKIFVKPAFAIGRLLWKGGDGRIIDGIGPDGVAARVVDGAKFAVRLQTGFIYNYAFAMLIGVAAIVTWFVTSFLVGGPR